jgi:hypothetical protein
MLEPVRWPEITKVDCNLLAYHVDAIQYGGPRNRSQCRLQANVAAAAAPRGAGTHFAHSVTIFASDIGRFVGPESVQR